MAIGDQGDMQGRLQAVLPRSWFPDATSVLSGVTAGLAAAWASVWDLLAYVRLQTRITTATEGNLDIIASDYLGAAFTRQPGEADSAFRSRIQRALLTPTATRAAVVAQLVSLTGNRPAIVEPRRPADTGGYASLPAAGGGGVGYGAGGAYGSLRMPFQAFLVVARPVTPGVPGVAGWSSGASGYGSLQQPALACGASEYVGLDDLRGVRDADIYQAIADTAPAASVVWTQVVDPAAVAGNWLDINFYLDRSALA